MASPTLQSEALTTWKEVANFLGKGVRTVQRWEKIGLPIHRPKTNRNLIIADREELRRWAGLKDSTAHLADEAYYRSIIETSRALVEETKRLAAEYRLIREQIKRLKL